MFFLYNTPPLKSPEEYAVSFPSTIFEIPCIYVHTGWTTLIYCGKYPVV